ncbi:MAG: hypothetical protein IJO29_04370 [Oscillospiraceae bacterium]|nr:hypothetical protein [Oscillospiraceae bacterium]
MKKNKKEKLIEAIVELVLTLLCLGIGVFVVGMFGVDIESDNLNYDLITLLGLIIFFLIFGVICALVQWFKKKTKGK